jgi:hypothetical protein
MAERVIMSTVSYKDAIVGAPQSDHLESTTLALDRAVQRGQTEDDADRELGIFATVTKYWRATLICIYIAAVLLHLGLTDFCQVRFHSRLDWSLDTMLL